MHSHVSSPRLASLLAEPIPAGPDAAAADFAEGLGGWLGALDAVRLREALQSIGTPTAARPSIGPAAARPSTGPAAAGPSSASPEGARSLAQAGDRVRAGLADAILAAPLADAGDGADYAPYRRKHVEHQRRMESRIGALRTQVRGALTQASTRLAQLAALDDAMATAFGEREQRLMAGLPALLERRFERLLDEHRKAMQASGQPDDPAAWRQPGGWLAAFEQLWRQALLAELDLRLEPVAGMIEAFSSEVAQCQ